MHNLQDLIVQSPVFVLGGSVLLLLVLRALFILLFARQVNPGSRY